MIDDILLIDKPSGMTSFGVVARIRRVLSKQLGRKVKVGHTGTLDPFATGLMILLTGKTTKRSDEFLKLDKVYEAEIVLGKISSTGDPEGEIVTTPQQSARGLASSKPTRLEVEGVLRGFVGEIEQVPPVYSAIKVGGERAYKLARQGQDVQMPARKVKIYSIEMIDYVYPSLRIRAHVSSGTYIRTLAEDIGRSLGVGAYCQELRRTQVGDLTIDQASHLEDFGIVD